MDILSIVLIVALVVAVIVIAAMSRRRGEGGGGGPVVAWLTAHAMRWNKLAVALLLFGVFRLMAGDELRPEESPPEVWWFAAGSIITALAAWMLAPDASKSEVLTLAETNSAAAAKSREELISLLKERAAA